jgi:cardiolipin synthase
MSEQQTADQEKLYQLLGKFWTFANVLSLVRLILVVPIFFLILTDGPFSLLFGLLLLAIVTDWFDGWLARWSHTVSEWGKVLDPVADKVAAGFIVLALTIRGSLPVWFLILIVVRDALIVLGSVVLTRKIRRVAISLWFGKAAVTALAITVLAALLKADEPILTFCIWATTFLLVLSWILYGVRYVRLTRQARLEREQAVENGKAPKAPSLSIHTTKQQHF